MSGFYTLILAQEEFNYIATQLLVAETEMPPTEHEVDDYYHQVKQQVKVKLDQAQVIGGEKAIRQNLELLVELANRSGAEGVWLLRGPLSQASARKVHGQTICTLDLEETDLLVVLRFPAGDGGEPGIESR